MVEHIIAFPGEKDMGFLFFISTNGKRSFTARDKEAKMVTMRKIMVILMSLIFLVLVGIFNQTRSLLNDAQSRVEHRSVTLAPELYR
jgi:hypothetical protein